jgi:hypothetical protein
MTQRVSKHEGFIILVKLWQFDANDRTQVRIDTIKMTYISDPSRPGAEVMPLFRDEYICQASKKLSRKPATCRSTRLKMAARFVLCRLVQHRRRPAAAFAPRL